jgi:uncharacterized protein YabN with tetrapyrrole methylase and pyrophosphatase domain
MKELKQVGKKLKLKKERSSVLEEYLKVLPALVKAKSHTKKVKAVGFGGGTNSRYGRKSRRTTRITSRS